MFYNKHLYAYKQKFIRLKIKITIDQIVIKPKFSCNTEIQKYALQLIGKKAVFS